MYSIDGQVRLDLSRKNADLPISNIPIYMRRKTIMVKAFLLQFSVILINAFIIFSTIKNE